MTASREIPPGTAELQALAVLAQHKARSANRLGREGGLNFLSADTGAQAINETALTRSNYS